MFMRLMQMCYTSYNKHSSTTEYNRVMLIFAVEELWITGLKFVQLDNLL